MVAHSGRRPIGRFGLEELHPPGPLGSYDLIQGIITPLDGAGQSYPVAKKSGAPDRLYHTSPNPLSALIVNHLIVLSLSLTLLSLDINGLSSATTRFAERFYVS